jgi:thiamine kinase-like enzyme
MKLVTDDFHDDASAQRFRQVMGSLEDLRREMEWLKSYLGASAEHRMNGDYALLNGPDDHHHQACDSVCVLCHNDAQPLNFVQTPNGDIVLIDMEYSGLNYPAFDIGCFFCEFAGVHGGVDYSRYPSEEIQKKWIYHYLKELARLKGEEHKTIPSEQVHRLYRDANQFALSLVAAWRARAASHDLGLTLC